MPAPKTAPHNAPREIRDKMARACQRIEQEIKKHPEFWQFDEQECTDTQGVGFRRFTAATNPNFVKTGREMMVCPKGPEFEDHDWPEMTKKGQKYLVKAARDAARAEKLRIGGRTAILVQNHEKGWCSVGYTYTVTE